MNPSAPPDVAIETARELVLLGGWDPWVQGLVAVLAVLVLGLTLYNYRGLVPLYRRLLLTALRLGVVLLLVAVFYQPAFLEEQIARGRNLVAVLVDTSESMGLAHGERSRIELARRFLIDQGDLWERLGEDNDLVFHAFAGELRELPGLAEGPETVGEIQPGGRSTAIAGALAGLADRYRNQDMGAILLLTDGIDTGPAGHRPRLDPATQAVVRDLDAPVLSFTLPDDGLLRDVAVAEVAYNNFAFMLNATAMDATIRVHGYDHGTLTARLLDNGAEVYRQTLHLAPGQRDYPVTFEYAPRKLGKQVYAVTVEHLPDEIYGGNNAKQVVVNVIRDKIRVLQIVGQPSWDERFLRNHLEQDPNVDLISFFILVGQHNVRPVSADETSLIPFPARELFEEELGGFDLAIFQNFNYGPFRTREYLPRIADFVREGGAFLMIGGPLSFSSGKYYGTPITDVLPLELPPHFGGEALVDELPFQARLTEAGAHHPITRLAQDPAVNRGLWSEMEELHGVNLVTRPKADAVVLLEHPARKDQRGAPMPVVAVREVGKGRSLALTTDTSYHWAFVAGNQGDDPRHFDTFWSNAIRWLIKDPAMDLVQVRVLREQLPVPEEARATVQVFLPDYRPAADQEVDVVVRLRDAGAGPGEGEVVLRLPEARTGAEGTLEVVVPVERAGIYEVEASARVVAGRLARGSDLFVASDVNPELEETIGDGRLLTLLAEASGGSVQALDTPTPEVEPRPPRVARVLSRRHDELWTSPWLLALLVGLLAMEWWLRRRYGFL